MQIKSLIDFLKASPTAWHAVEVIQAELEKKGFQALKETAEWKIKPGKGYYIIRNGSSLIAFTAPKKNPLKALVCASHLDSPGFKLKPHAVYLKEDMLMTGLDIYGAPLLTSWLNRELGIAGRVVTSTAQGIKEKLVNITHAPLVIPQLAIHLDREVNTQGLVLNKQEHLAALAAIGISSEEEAKSYFSKLIGSDPLLGSDLFLYPLELPAFAGPDQQMLAGYRMDSLCSVHAIFTAFLSAVQPDDHSLNICAFWDNEEIGSETAQGAASPFFSETLERVMLSLGSGREDYLRLVSSSLCVSVDLTHGLHPNYPDKHEPRHKIFLGKGIVIKHSSQHRYASNARTAGYIKSVCLKHSIPFQEVISRGDLPSGTTIGPIHANITGMPTVDIGNPQLSMHSARELIACSDHEKMITLLGKLYAKESFHIH